MGTPITEAQARGGRFVGTLVSLVFFLVGTAIVCAVFLPLLQEVWHARAWQEGACTIVASRVARHGKSKPTYSVDVRYRYDVDGLTYDGTRYQLFSGSSSGRADKQAVVDTLPPGSSVRCYYDPRAPATSVLERGLTGDVFFIAIPLLFMLVGVGGLYAARRIPRVAVTCRMAPLTDDAEAPPTPPPRRAERLRPTTTRGARAIVVLLFAVVWNGLVTLFVLDAWRRHHVGLGLFLVPFVLLGLGAVGFFVHAFLALFNPIVEVTLAREPLVVGGAVQVRWRVLGRAGRFRALVLRLEGKESAIYRQGDETRTDTHAFTRTVVATATTVAQVRAGWATLRVPADAMHSFAASHSRIEWTLALAGDIPAWPDVAEVFPLEVGPGAAPVAGGGYREPALPPSAPFVAEGDPALHLTLSDPHAAFAPGATLSGQLGWTLPPAATALELRLFWRTHGKGTPNVEVVDRLRIDAPPAYGQRAFSFVLPLQPHSFTGTLVSLAWGLELVAIGADAVKRGELVVAPGRRAIVLPHDA